jgi:hypothetical protein
MARPRKGSEYLWGYGSGVAAAITADYGDVVLAEYTQPFNENDVTYYRSTATAPSASAAPCSSHTRQASCVGMSSLSKAKAASRMSGLELGGQMRVTLDRDGPLYHAVYTQRTTCERINSQAQALGIERPKVRHQRSVEHPNTLIYVVIHVRALQRAKSINKRLLLRE